MSYNVLNNKETINKEIDIMGQIINEILIALTSLI